MSISSSAVLVELNISVWTANKLDKAATGKLTSDNSAVSDAAQVRKNLMAGTSHRKELSDYAAGCRLWHNLHTNPWSDKGVRLLPTSLFINYKSEANVRRDTFNRKRDDFLAVYPALVQTASNYLGTLFDADDYPSVDEVASKFDFRLVFSPVPESGHFMLDIPAQELAEVREQYDNDFDTRMAKAMEEPWKRLHTLLSGMSAKLTDAEGDDTKKRYHDSLITNAHTLCEMLTHLNVTKDPNLEQARQQLELAMLGADIDVLKENPVAREKMKSKVDIILEQYEW